jgi:hypothetical protein
VTSHIHRSTQYARRFSIRVIRRPLWGCDKAAVKHHQANRVFLSAFGGKKEGSRCQLHLISGGCDEVFHADLRRLSPGYVIAEISFDRNGGAIRESW